MRTLLTVLILSGISTLLLSVKIILQKGGRFTIGHACQSTDEKRNKNKK